MIFGCLPNNPPKRAGVEQDAPTMHSGAISSIILHAYGEFEKQEKTVMEHMVGLFGHEPDSRVIKVFTNNVPVANRMEIG